MPVDDADVQVLLASMQKSPELADAGVAVVTDGGARLVRSPKAGRSDRWILLAELTPQNAPWPEALWHQTVQRQMARAGVLLGDVVTTGVTGRYAGLVGIAAPNGAVGAAGADQMLQATKQMQEMNMSFNLQYLALQQQMQNENRMFTMLSNIMKTRHDTAKNAISNVR
jgi:hypothetical protein